MANYKLSPNAKDDLERIWFYGLEQWGQEMADRYLQELFEAIGKCPSSYKMGHQTGLSLGGSGSSLGLIMQPAFNVASGDTGLSVS